jgi:hypothetical protein
MANQDPQPEIYTTSHRFDASGGAIAAFTSSTVSIFTNQAGFLLTSFGFVPTTPSSYCN